MNVVSLEWRKYLEKQEQLLLYYIHIGKVKIEVAQSCPTLCDPIDCSLPGSSVHGIFQAIVLEGIAISFSRGSSQPRARTQVSRIVEDALPSEPPGKSIQWKMGWSWLLYISYNIFISYSWSWYVYSENFASS